MLKLVLLYLMAALYVAAGVNHFLRPRMYVRIIPPYLPAPELLNYAAGAAEMVLGVALLFPATRPWAAWGIIALLVAVFPANLYMYQQGTPGIPSWALLLRLPLQGALIAWAWWYTR
ncbi:MAG: MauE/DoxX family redox-associated membrane protein [Tunicatimonas sp.]